MRYLILGSLVVLAAASLGFGEEPLRQFDPGEDPLAAPGQWWSGRTAGLVGGIAGSLFGCLGAVFGILVGAGKARGFVTWLSRTTIALGLAGLAAGVVALSQSQPYCVYYPLLLLGVIVVGVFGPLHVVVLGRRYEELELRKMAAMDADTDRVPSGRP